MLHEPPRVKCFSAIHQAAWLTFGNESDAQTHMDTGELKLVLERETVYDSVRRK